MMRIFPVLLSAAIAFAGLSCGGDGQPQGQANTSLNNVPPPAATGGAASASAGSAPHPRDVAKLDGDAPPADARYTISCAIFRGPDHVTRSAHFKDELIAKSGLHNWHILHTEQQSNVSFGYYRSYGDRENDGKETARAQGDLKLVAALKDGQGDPLFKLPLFVAIDEQDPESPAAWNLVNAPPWAYWTLQIAAYRGSNERKQAAVDCVRKARAAGIEAYYYHGDTISSVCIGAWPREAVKEQDSASAHTADPTAIPLIVSQPLPPHTSTDMHDSEGNRLTVVAPKLEITDPRMAEAIAHYPDHAVNGEVHAVRTKDGQLIHDASFLVAIPHGDAIPDPIGQTTAVNPASAADRAASDIIDPVPAQQQPPRTKLRSLGD